MSTQLIADMNSMMVALQIVVNIISAIALGALAVYLIGVALLCLEEVRKQTAQKVALKPATAQSSRFNVLARHS